MNNIYYAIKTKDGKFVSINNIERYNGIWLSKVNFTVFTSKTVLNGDLEYVLELFNALKNDDKNYNGRKLNYFSTFEVDKVVNMKNFSILYEEEVIV